MGAFVDVFRKLTIWKWIYPSPFCRLNAFAFRYRSFDEVVSELEWMDWTTEGEYVRDFVGAKKQIEEWGLPVTTDTHGTLYVGALNRNVYSESRRVPHIAFDTVFNFMNSSVHPGTSVGF